MDIGSTDTTFLNQLHNITSKSHVRQMDAIERELRNLMITSVELQVRLSHLFEVEVFRLFLRPFLAERTSGVGTLSSRAIF